MASSKGSRAIEDNINAIEGDPINLTNDEEGETVSQYDSIDTSKLTSPHWKLFTRVLVQGVWKAKCWMCSKLINGDTKNGTSHLRRHTDEYCPRRQQNNRDVSQMLLGAKMTGNNKEIVGNYAFKQETSRRELALMIIEHEYPLSIVDHHRFRSYTYSLNPSFHIPSRNTIKMDCMKIYSEYRNIMIREMHECFSRISLTTDLWASKHQKRGYMAITAHYIDSSWTLRKRLLRLCYVPAPHNAATITKYLIGCIDNWSLEHRLCTITVDNASTNDHAIQNLILRMKSGAVLLNGNFFHVRCAAHILNLIVQDGLEVIKHPISKVRDSVLFWTATPKRVERFELAAKQEQVEITTKLSYDCKTRWNSTYLMLEAALRYKDVFSRLQLRESLYTECPSPEDWEVAEVVSEKLKIFHDITVKFSGTRYPTTNLFLVEMCNMKLQLDEWVLSTNDIVARLAIQMRMKLDKYWSSVFGILGVAAVLDPRFKNDVLECYFEKLYGDNANTQVAVVINLLKDLVYEYENRRNKEPSKSGDSTSSSEGNIQYFTDFMGRKRQKRPRGKTDLDNYLDEMVIPWKKDFDILSWWKTHGLQYPILQAIAKDILAIPISTVASESVFSMSGRVVGPHRSRLHPSTIEALACAQSWIRNENGEYATTQLFGDILQDEEDDQQVQGLIEGLEMIDLVGYPSPAGSGIKEDLGLSTAEFAVFVSIADVGGAIGALICGKGADILGRKGTMWVADIVFCFGWLSIAFANDVFWLDIGRLSCGIGFGLITYVAPVYIAEITPKNLRGAYSSSTQLFLCLGFSLLSFLGTLISWRPLAIVGCSGGVVQLVGLFLIPESPRWLAKTGRGDLKASLQRLRGENVDVSQQSTEIQEYRETFESISRSNIFTLFQKQYLHAVIVGTGLVLLRQLSRWNAITAYADEIFEFAGFSTTIGSDGVAIIQIPATLISVFLTDISGRRILLMISAAGMCFSSFIVGLSFLQKGFHLATEITPLVCFSGIMLFSIAFGVGMGAIPWLIVSEIFPVNLKASVSYSFSFIFDWSSAGAFFIYATVCGFAVLFVAKLVPETELRQIEEIQAAMNHFT